MNTTEQRQRLAELLARCDPEEQFKWELMTKGIEGEELAAAIEIVERALAVRTEAAGAGR